MPYGSEMMPAAKIAEAVRRFGPIFQQGYACFEALPPITWLLPEEHIDAQGNPVSDHILASVGRVVDKVDQASLRSHERFWDIQVHQNRFDL
ncbi:MAG: hypothetical protein ABW068_17785 [Candidatus Thiodiazotropha sp.]